MDDWFLQSLKISLKTNRLKEMSLLNYNNLQDLNAQLLIHQDLIVVWERWNIGGVTLW
jgi:hypothetical protein